MHAKYTLEIRKADSEKKEKESEKERDRSSL